MPRMIACWLAALGIFLRAWHIEAIALRLDASVTPDAILGHVCAELQQRRERASCTWTQRPTTALTGPASSWTSSWTGPDHTLPHSMPMAAQNQRNAQHSTTRNMLQ